jgi:hypothetical protein
LSELLFDKMARTETRAKNEREPIYAYYNSSAREPIAALRGFLQQWFDSYPTGAQKDLLARFRSPIDSQHKSAFWELYLHELFTRIGYTLEPHPTVAGSPNHPDYLVSGGGEPRFYLEAIVAGLPPVKDAGAEARLAEVFDLINELESAKYFLELQYRGVPNTPPPVRKLRRVLETWLGSHDLNAIDEACKEGHFDVLPRFEWSHDGLTLSFRPLAKHSASRDARLIGITMPYEGHMLTTDEDIRDAVGRKAKKYGELSLPLVVAVNVVSEHCDDIDINSALFGSETFRVAKKPDGSYTTGPGQRAPNGVWFDKKGARNRYVSAVLIGINLDPYWAGTTTPVLIHNPYPKNPLVLPSYPLSQSVPDHATRTMQKKEGKKANEFLRLPSPWPPPLD